MNLGVFINQAFYTDGKKSFTDLSFIRFIESFGSYFNKIIVFAPSLRQEAEYKRHYACSDIIRLSALPHFGNVKDLAKRAATIIPATRKILVKDIRECDVAWIVGPHPLGLLFYRVARRHGVNLFYHIRGNILNDVGTRYSGKEYWLARLYAQYMHFENKFLARRLPTMVVGSELYELYKPISPAIFQISPSLITESDVETSRTLLRSKGFARNDRIHLLFVGRLEPEKGLEYLFNAVSQFNAQSQVPCSVTIVGAAQKGSEAKGDAIRERARELGLDSYITWKGYVAYGEELIAIYREADIFVLPSLSEGIPKVLYEAMAAGVPIVCTRIGGMPDVIAHQENGYLVTPGSAEEIHAAIKDIAGSPELRERLIEGGFRTVEGHTMEKARDLLISILERCRTISETGKVTAAD